MRIKKSLWSETSPNLLQDESYTAMAYTPTLSLPEPQRYFSIYSPIQGHLHPHACTNRCPLSWNGNSSKQLMLPNVSWPRGFVVRDGRARLRDDRLPSLAINYSAAALALRHGWSLCRQGFLSSQTLCSLQRALRCLQDSTLCQVRKMWLLHCDCEVWHVSVELELQNCVTVTPLLSHVLLKSWINDR